MFVHVSEDPEAAWARIAPHALHESNSYAEWAAGARGGVYDTADDPDELRASGQYQVLTPAEAVDLARRGPARCRVRRGRRAPHSHH